LYDNYWVLILGMLATCCSVCAISCVPSVGRKFPLNYTLLAVIAVGMGLVLGYSTAATKTSAFATAAGMTAAVTFACSLFAWQTKYDFTGKGPYLIAFLVVLLVFGIVAAIVRNRIVQLVYASLGALLFSMYIVYDTQTIVGGKNRKYQLSIDDYCFGALTLYLDIINLFMMILQLLSLTDSS